MTCRLFDTINEKVFIKDLKLETKINIILYIYKKKKKSIYMK